MPSSRHVLVLSGLSVLPALWLWAQAPAPSAPAAPAAPANPSRLSPEERARLERLAREDHAEMMRQLGITRLRPGPDGWAAAGEPNAANYDPARANPHPDWPDVLTMKDGREVTTAEMWWEERRPEIVEDFEREVYGRVPEDVTMAFEPRFAVALVGSSGQGGAKPHRRNFGEVVENLTGPGEYHWMAGNFLKYGATEASFGSRNADDIPVDAHQLLAPCAPRPTFISYGLPEKGDAQWLDQQGSFMATVAAGPAFRLLGARDVGMTEDYRVAKMPPHNAGLLDGELAWRQHDGGHEDRSNMSFFVAWANRLLDHTPPQVPADQPRMRADHNSHLAHRQLLAKARSGGIDVYFLGDSITRRWGATDYPELLAHWKTTFHGWNAGNFGWGGDRTENILWRLENGELDGVDPKVIVLLAGTNNVGREPGDAAKVADITRGLKAIVDTCRRKAPAATIVLTAIFPRNDNIAVVPTIARINAGLARLADGTSIRFLDVNPKLADADGRLFEGMMVDKLHPSLKGYEVWAEGLRPILTELLGPPAATDHAPPPTGDPSACERPDRESDRSPLAPPSRQSQGRL